MIISSEGVQQGDPLGPLLFCLTNLEIAQAIKSEFCVFYLHDATLGGPVDQVLEDLASVEVKARNLGLKLNHGKSELIGLSKVSRDKILSSFPSLKITHPEDAILLGSPIGGKPTLDAVIRSKIDKL